MKAVKALKRVAQHADTSIYMCVCVRASTGTCQKFLIKLLEKLFIISCIITRVYSLDELQIEKVLATMRERQGSSSAENA